jgi:hypothetical protein
MDYSTIAIADKLGIHASVVENYEEEWLAQEERNISYDLPPTEGFEEFICRVFAECAFLVEATEGGGNAMQCLEAYDEAYSTVEEILA